MSGSVHGEERATTHNAFDGTVNGKLVQGRTVGSVHTGSGHVFAGPVVYQEFPVARDALVVRVNERLDAAEELVRELAERERELRAGLAAEVSRGDDLERQLVDVRRQVTEGYAIADDLKDQLRRLQDAHDEEVRRVAGLQAELAAVVARRRDAEHAVELIRSEQQEMNDFFGSMEDLLNLQFVRAEQERREKETLQEECKNLQARVVTLERTLALYQARD